MNKLKQIIIVSVWLIASNLCFATLGQNIQSINVDSSNLNATMQSYDHGTYKIYVLTTANEDDDAQWSVREYIDPNNDVVFGVAWNGISTDAADMILGGYLQQAEDLYDNHEQQNMFDYNVHGDGQDYNGYFVLLPVLPMTVNPSVVH